MYYGKLLKVNNQNNSRKYTYFCKFCQRQFVKDSLLNHMHKTCKKKDKEIANLELQKLQCLDDQQSKISFIEEKGNKMKLDEMLYETDVNHPLRNMDSDDSDDDITDPEFDNNSYGNWCNNIPNPNLVNPDNNNYPNELPEIKDDEKEDYEEFQKLMYIAGLQGIMKTNKCILFTSIKGKKTGRTNEIKYYYMTIRRRRKTEN